MSTDSARPAEALTGPDGQRVEPLGVTTARVEREGQRPVALELAAELGATFIERDGRSVERVFADEGLASLVVVSADGVFWQPRGEGQFFWHPNMALVRIRTALKSGLADPVVRAPGLEPGDRVLDATLGLGADAVVVSQALGPTGEVVGIERSPLIAALVRRGLARYEHRLAAAMRRIRVVCGDHRALLADDAFCGPGFAAILFDPMFEHTIGQSNGLNGVRLLACYDRLAPETIALARTRVQRAVVVKGRSNDPWLESLGPDKLVGGRNKRVAYAVFSPRAG